MSHDHCDCVKGLEEHIAWQREQLAEQDARGLRLAGEVERLQKVVDAFEQAYVRDGDEGERLRGLLRVQTDLNVDLQVQAEEQQRDVARLRDEIADLRGDGFPVLAEEVSAEDNSPR